MRGLILLLAFSITLAHAAWNDYVEARDLSLDSDGIGELEIEAGAGQLTVVGVPDLAAVEVKATITVSGRSEDHVQEVIADDMVLTLTRAGRTAVLKGYFDQHGSGWEESPTIDLEVRVPARLALSVDDGSGALDVRDVSGDIEIDDGSGSITLAAVGGEVRIEDGSGSITVEGVGGSLFIVDGSGSIDIRRVGGSVTIDDGSGGIDVSDVEQDLVIEESGSGSLRVANVRGSVRTDR